MTSWRWKSRSGSASRPRSPRPSALSASVRTAAPLCGMPAAVELLVHQARRTARARRRARPCVRAARRRVRRRRRAARRRVPRRRDPTPRRRASRRADATPRRVGVGELEVEAGHRGAHGASARGSPLVPATTVTGTRRRERAQQRGRGSRELLREVHDDRAEVGEQRHAGGDLGGRGVHEVALVVPLGRERCADAPADAHDVGGAGAGAHEGVERGVVEVRQLTVRGDQRRLGRRVLGHRAEPTGSVGEHRAHRRPRAPGSTPVAGGRRRASAPRAARRAGTQ